MIRGLSFVHYNINISIIYYIIFTITIQLVTWAYIYDNAKNKL